MAKYDPKSLKAEEFINHEEILDTVAYAEENKRNTALIDEILEKAKKRKGLNHREASVLLACENEEKINGYIGNVGYPTFATKEKGKIIYERMM